MPRRHAREFASSGAQLASAAWFRCGRIATRRGVEQPWRSALSTCVSAAMRRSNTDDARGARVVADAAGHWRESTPGLSPADAEDAIAILAA
jgi:hypothetical protein